MIRYCYRFNIHKPFFYSTNEKTTKITQNVLQFVLELKLLMRKWSRCIFNRYENFINYGTVHNPYTAHDGVDGGAR